MISSTNSSYTISSYTISRYHRKLYTNFNKTQANIHRTTSRTAKNETIRLSI